MTKRFRMIAGPNGSGKSTLVRMLRGDYAVNFYAMLNSDDIFAEVARTKAYSPTLPVSEDALLKFVAASEYSSQTKSFFLSGDIAVRDDTIRFGSPESVNTYTVALLTNYLQQEHIATGKSFSQETVFSHPSKIVALKAAKESGFRTYLYFVANRDIAINIARIANRVKSGGHDVPVDKVASRARRCIDNIAKALPYCSRAYFFDNSGIEMRFLAEYSEEGGFISVANDLPTWFRSAIA